MDMKLALTIMDGQAQKITALEKQAEILQDIVDTQKVIIDKQETMINELTETIQKQQDFIERDTSSDD